MARPLQRVGDLLADRVAVGVLTRAFPPELVDRVVDRFGVRERRTRALPARLMVYYVLTMVMFFRSGYGEVWDKLVAGLAWARPYAARHPRAQPTPAAITYARKRLGWQVMAMLLEEAIAPQVQGESGHVRVGGMRLVALDEAPLSLPNTRGNVSVFGYPSGDPELGLVPQARVMALGDCGTSAILAAGVSGVASDETPLVRRLLRKLVPGDLLAVGGMIPLYDLLGEVIASGAHVLWQAGPEEDLPRLATFADGTYLSRLAGPAARDGSGGTAPGLVVRVIPDTGEGPPAARDRGKSLLVTDVLDAQALPAEAGIAVHASRWRLEDCFSTLDLLPPGESAVTLRSKDPDLIRQEVYAILCCYQAVRLLVGRSPNGHAAPEAIPHQPANSLGSARPLPARVPEPPREWPDDR